MKRMLAVALVVGLAGFATIATAASTHTVAIDGTAYVPRTIKVKRGDSVVWTNKDPFPHTVTAAGAFDSKEIAAGRTWKLVTSSVGEFAYTCTFHPNMKGVLIVE